MSSVVSSPTYPNRRQKSVTFSAVTVVKTTVVPSSTMTDERKDELWYGRDALENFKKAARRDGKAHRRESMSMPLSSRTALTSSDGDYSSSSSDDDTNGFSSPGSCSQRGLENRISLLLERQRNKYVAHRAILECARRLASSPLSLPSPPNRPASTIPVDADDHLALVSSKVTRWSREVALSTGRNNFYAAYPKEAAAQNNVRSCRCPHGLTLQQINARYPFPVSFKRNGRAGMGSTTTPTTMATSPSSTTGAATFAAAIAVADFGPIPTKFNVSSIQEDDSDDEHRRRLANARYPFPVSFKRNGRAGMGSTTTPTTMATSPSSTTGAATFAAAIAVADFGPIPTKFNVSSIQEDDSDDEHRRRLAKRRRR